MGSGPDPPCRAKCELLGVEALLPLAVLATSRGLGAGGTLLPAVAGFVAIFYQRYETIVGSVDITVVAIDFGGRCCWGAGFGEEILGD